MRRLRYVLALMIVVLVASGTTGLAFGASQGEILNLAHPPLANGVIINIPSRTLYLVKRGRVVNGFPVAVGANGKGTQTPGGLFRVTYKKKNPAWKPPGSMRKANGWPAGYEVPPGPDNPLGTRWMSITREGDIYRGYGIHGTSAPSSIGRAISHGCIRMNNADVETVFSQVRVGTPVLITYSRLVLKANAHSALLRVYPDIYQRQPLDGKR